MGNPESPSKQGSGQGYFIKKKVAFLLAAGVLVSLVGVALITYFVGVDGNSSGKGGGSGGEEPTNPTDPSKPSKLTDIRLPSHLKPLSYDVRLVPFLVEGNFTIDGSIKITLDCLKGGSRNITLHSYDIDVDAGSLVVKEKAGRSDDGLGIADTRYDKEREFFIIELSESLEEGKTYEVAMEFKGILGDNLKGFYRSSFTNEDDKKEYIAVTQFQPTDARRAFPCFDEPALKAKFRITLGRLPGQTAISNMPLQETKVDTGRYSGYEFDTFEESEPMSTYLVAMVICSFEFKESLTDNEAKTKFRIWARDSVIDQTAFAKEVGPKILKHFEDFFGVKYPLPKQDMIAIPDFAAGAMENWGLITYREIALLFKEGVSSVLSKQKIATVISHELAHQWFGNLVTPKWWTDLWLNEGFASFVEYLGVENAVPEFHLQEQFVYMDLQHVFGIDALESSHPISIPVGHPSEINEIFDKISYSKGASIIRMMDSFLTRDTLKKGLKNYLTDNQFDAAEQDDLWEHLTAQAHKDETLSKDKSVKEIMDTWTLQMGFPVVTTKRDYELGKIELNQERFLLSESGKSNDTHDYQWVIPLTFAQPGGDFGNTKNNAWLGDKKLELDVKDADKTKPMIFNVQQTGYFRVNYDEKTWDLIIKSISSDPSSVHVLNRAQILDDSLNLARAGRLSYEIALNTLSNLEVEAAYVPWSSALTGISFLNQMLQRTPAYGNFKKYVEKLVSKRYEELQFDPIDGESHLDKLLRVKIIGWACKMGNPECLSKVQEKFQAWRDSNDTDANNPINVDIRSKVYCNAIAEGGEDEWDFLWDRYLKSDVPSDKLTMLSALSCTKKIWLLNRFLERSVNASSGIRKQDGSGVISSIAQRTIGRDLAFDFVRDNWGKIASYYGRAAFSFSGIIRAVMANRNTRFELKELEDFHEDHKNEFSSATRTAEQAIENAKNNIAWMDSSYETIQSVLEGKITDDA